MLIKLLIYILVKNSNNYIKLLLIIWFFYVIKIIYTDDIKLFIIHLGIYYHANFKFNLKQNAKYKNNCI